MKKIFVLLIVFVLFICNNSNSAIGTQKTLFVELFGTDIFTVDETGDGVYERQDQLIQYAVSHNYEIIILYDLWRVYDGNGVRLFPKDSKPPVKYMCD